MYKTYFMIGFILLLLFGFELFSVASSLSWIGAFDSFFIEHIRGGMNIESSWTILVKILSKIGSSKLIILLSFIIMIGLFWRRKFLLGVWFFLSVGISMLVLKILKGIVARPRPDELGWFDSASGFSYPSGHSLSISIFCSLIALLVFFSKTKIFFKSFIGILATLLMVWVMYSRVYLGVHYPSDVLGGFLLGLTFAFFSVGIYARFFKI